MSKQASNKELSANIVPRGCAGTLAVVLAQSIDYTRTRLGVDARNPAGQRQFTGIVDCYVKYQIQKTFKVSKQASNKEKLAKNIVSGGCAGSLSLVFVQSIDYTRTRLDVDARNPGPRKECYV